MPGSWAPPVLPWQETQSLIVVPHLGAAYAEGKPSPPSGWTFEWQYTVQVPYARLPAPSFPSDGTAVPDAML
jgi:hypothetical protein